MYAVLRLTMMTTCGSAQQWLARVSTMRVGFLPKTFLQALLYSKKVGMLGELLASQNIKAIEVDGNNQKWVATDGAGVFLFAEDGKKTIHHFTKEQQSIANQLFAVWPMTINPEKSILVRQVVLLRFKGMPMRHPKPWRTSKSIQTRYALNIRTSHHSWT